MSSTNRSEARKEHISDYYVTPQDQIELFLKEFEKDCDIFKRKFVNILDPCSGGDEAEAVSSMFWAQKKEKPFYKIFIEVTADKMGLDIPGVVQKTGLTDKQVRTIITRQMKVAPLDLAMQLSDTLNVPLEVWLGIENYAPAEVSTDAYEVARAYDQADIKSKNMVRMALDLELAKEETV